jgi:tetratricopeptide (TPR) repeat protein
MAIASNNPRGIWIARAETIGQGQTLEDHYQDVIRWTSRRIEAEFHPGLNLFHRAEAYLGLKETAKATADLERLVQLEVDPSASTASSYNSIAWQLVTGPEQKRNTDVALWFAQNAAKSQPTKSNFQNTLGVALYRSGQYRQALTILQTIDGVLQLTQPGRVPSNVAFIAMAQYQLEQREEAMKSLERLRGLLKEGSYADDPEAQEFLREAEALFGTK